MKLLFDFFPILLFFAAYKVYGIYAATAAAVAASVLQVAYSWLRHRRVEKMLLISMGLIVVLGGATLILHDEVFIKWKPTAVNWLFATAFLASRFVGERTLAERMLGSAISVQSAVWRRVNLSWAIFFIVTGVLNLYVAFYYAPELDPKTRTDIWVDFKVYGILGLTIAFIIAQAFYLGRHAQPITATEEEQS